MQKKNNWVAAIFPADGYPLRRPIDLQRKKLIDTVRRDNLSRGRDNAGHVWPRHHLGLRGLRGVAICALLHSGALPMAETSKQEHSEDRGLRDKNGWRCRHFLHLLFDAKKAATAP
jgi:hypothetical protein